MNQWINESMNQWMNELMRESHNTSYGIFLLWSLCFVFISHSFSMILTLLLIVFFADVDLCFVFSHSHIPLRRCLSVLCLFIFSYQTNGLFHGLANWNSPVNQTQREWLPITKIFYIASFIDFAREFGIRHENLTGYQANVTSHMTHIYSYDMRPNVPCPLSADRRACPSAVPTGSCLLVVYVI